MKKQKLLNMAEMFLLGKKNNFQVLRWNAFYKPRIYAGLLYLNG